MDNDEDNKKKDKQKDNWKRDLAEAFALASDMSWRIALTGIIIAGGLALLAKSCQKQDPPNKTIEYKIGSSADSKYQQKIHLLYEPESIGPTYREL